VTTAAPKLRLLRLLCTAIVALLAQGFCVRVTLAQTTHDQVLRPFTARYDVRYYGISGGTIELTLRKGAQPNEYVYESRAKPGFIASFLISDAARENCTMIVDANGVRPIKFVADDGKKSTDQDAIYQYDWEGRKLVGRTGSIDLSEELPDRLQDHLSVQIAMIWALQQHAALGEFPLIDGGEIKRFLYTKDGVATVTYRGRQLDTTIVRSARADNPGGRINRYWHATDFGNVPIRAERSRNGKVDLTIDLLDLQFTE
jgi:hypothetical protein